MDWKSIESAPRDGTRILYGNRFDEIGHCRWAEGYREGDEPCWWDTERDDEVVPTHWMDALPEIPK